MKYIDGLLFGFGFITAAAIFKLILHISICG